MVTSAAPNPLKIVEFDAAKVHTPAGNRKITPESVRDLLASVEKDGQLIAGIAFRDATLPDGEVYCADGNRRLMVARILGRPFRAYVLESAPSEEDLILIRVVANFHRKNATAYELAADIEKWMALKGASQKEAAAFFGISVSQVSKILNKARNAVQEVVLAEKDKLIVEDVGRLLATLPKEQQPGALQHVIANKMTRDDVEPWVAGLRGFKRIKEATPVSVTEGGATIRLPASWSWQRIIDLAAKLTDAAKRGMKVDGLTITALPGLLRP